MKRHSRKGLKTQKKGNKRRLLILLSIAVLFTIAIIEFIYFFYAIEYVKTYELFLRVDDRIGLNVDVESSRIDLGIVPPGGSVKREFAIANNGTKPLAGGITVRGDLAKFISAERDFIIGGNEIKRVSLIASVPRDTQIGNYTGKMILVVKRI